MLSNLPFPSMPVRNRDSWGASLPRPIGRVRTDSAWTNRFAGVQGRRPCLPGLAVASGPREVTSGMDREAWKARGRGACDESPQHPTSWGGERVYDYWFKTARVAAGGHLPVTHPASLATRGSEDDCHWMSLPFFRLSNALFAYSTQPHSLPGWSSCDALRSRAVARPGCGFFVGAETFGSGAYLFFYPTRSWKIRRTPRT